MGTNARRPPKSSASLNYSDADDAPLMNPGDPEVARAECCRWYYQIVPPSSLPLADGADYDWINALQRAADIVLQKSTRDITRSATAKHETTFPH